jgi:SAM-dependent methyltransferase
MRNAGLEAPIWIFGATISLSAVAAFLPSTFSYASKAKLPFKIGKATETAYSFPFTLFYQRKIVSFDPDEDFALKSGDWPYTEKDMNRLDSSDDARFYDNPRFVTHIDDRAIASLTAFYQDEFESLLAKEIPEKRLDILDLCSSWISHLPGEHESEVRYGRVAGVGMNREELERNGQLTEYYVQDLNKHSTLSQFKDCSFDVVANVVSVDYLTNPKLVFEEMHRLLRPGGIALVSFSNRCFATKAVALWLQADDIDRLTIVASYFHYAASWSSLEAIDIIPEKQLLPERPSMQEMLSNPSKGFAWMNTASAVQKGNSGDPMFVIRAVK